MDSSDEAASVRNPIKEGCEKEASKDNKVVDRPVNQLVGVENVFTSMSQERSSSFVPVNGSRPRSSDDSEQRVNRTKENNLQRDTIGHTFDGNQMQMVNNESNNIHNTESPCSSKVESTCDKRLDSNCDIACQRYKMYSDKVGSSGSVNGPSTSGTNKSNDNTESGGIRENRKRPSTLKLDRPSIDDNDSSSDTGNDDYSLGSEDGCIYTYRGGEHLADLPSSFFSLDMGLPLDRHLPLLPNYPVPQQGPANAREQGSRASSPDMDFLEMDFDPGPSCEVDTDDESSPDADLEVENSLPEEIEPVIRGTTPEYVPSTVVNPQPSTSAIHNETEHSLNVPSTSYGVEVTQSNIDEEVTNDQEYGPYITHVNFRGEQFLVRRTTSSWPSNTLAGLHVSNGDLVSPREVLNYEEERNKHEGAHAYEINQGERPTGDSVNLSSALYHITMAKRLMIQKTCSDVESHDAANVSRDQGAGCSSDGDTGCVEPPHCMVWSEREACERQVTQIGTSACGATAVVNVFIALGVPVNIERINAAVGTRLRANNAPIPRYLLSRSVAGCTAADLVTGIQRASDGLVTARFFPMHPERAMSLSHWLADWISLGAVPILTLNLQVGCEGEIPDAWHHQMVFGVSPRGVYLCNPCECVPERALWARLTSPSVLLVRARDIIARLTPNMDLSVLMAVPDIRFHTFNVLGQVASVIREWRARGWCEAGLRARHVRLPAAYQAGVTVAALTGSEAHRRLVHAPPPPPCRAPTHAAHPAHPAAATLGTRNVSDGRPPQ